MSGHVFRLVLYFVFALIVAFKAIVVVLYNQTRVI